MRSGLYTGTLVHSRREPARNSFRYRMSFYCLDLDELPQIERRLRLFSVNRPNLFALYDRDHFDDDGRPLKEKVVAFAGDPGIERVVCLTQLRVLGYVFNPVSFYWCYGLASSAGADLCSAEPASADASTPEAGESKLELRCMIAELNNTFGERLPELLRGDSLTYEHDKRLHVSPFFGLDHRYRYTFSEPEERVFARIDVLKDGRRPLVAVLQGRRRELTDAALARAFVRYPLMPVQVMGLIHWQALRLWLKHVPFHRKPPFVPGAGSVRS